MTPHSLKHRFLLFDFPDEDEIANRLSTEAKMIEAILHGSNRGHRVVRHRFKTSKGFLAAKPIPVAARFVHLAAHANRKGVGFHNGLVLWDQFAKRVVRYLRPRRGKKRVIVFSCCHSLAGFKATKHIFERHFTAAYLLKPKGPRFAEALAIWPMFYLRKKSKFPHARIADRINRCVGKKLLVFRRY